MTKTTFLSSFQLCLLGALVLSIGCRAQTTKRAAPQNATVITSARPPQQPRLPALNANPRNEDTDVNDAALDRQDRPRFSKANTPSAQAASPTPAKERRPTSTTSSSTSLDDKILDMTFRPGEPLEINQLLQSWGLALGQIVIADPNIRGRKITILTPQAKLSWRTFKKILGMNGIVIVEEEVAPGKLLIKAFQQRHLATKTEPPLQDHPIPLSCIFTSWRTLDSDSPSRV